MLWGAVPWRPRRNAKGLELWGLPGTCCGERLDLSGSASRFRCANVVTVQAKMRLVENATREPRELSGCSVFNDDALKLNAGTLAST